MKSPEEWQELFSQIENEAKLIILSPAALATLKDPAVSIQISIDELNHSKNARAKKLAENSYAIILDAGLVAWLFELSKTMLNDCLLIFYDLNREEANIEKAAMVLFKIWINFIIFHEWAHIICGHLSFSKNKSVWFEMISDHNKPPKITNQEVICLEAEADAFATKFIAELHIFLWRILSEEVYGAFRPNSITYDVVMAVTLLFEAFESISMKSEVEATHPTIAQRMNIFNVYFFSVMEKYKISNIDFKTIVLKSNFDYFQWRKEMEIEEITSMLSDLEAFNSHVGKTLASLNVQDRRLSVLAYHYKH